MLPAVNVAPEAITRLGALAPMILPLADSIGWLSDRVTDLDTTALEDIFLPDDPHRILDYAAAGARNSAYQMYADCLIHLDSALGDSDYTPSSVSRVLTRMHRELNKVFHPPCLMATLMFT